MLFINYGVFVPWRLNKKRVHQLLVLVADLIPEPAASLDFDPLSFMQL